MLVSSFLFLKNFPWLCHTPSPIMPKEMGRAPSHHLGRHFRRPLSLSLVVGSFCTDAPAAWGTLCGREHHGQSKWRWFASFVLTVKAGDISGTANLKEPQSLHLLHQHGGWSSWVGGTMWKAMNAKKCQSQRFQSPHSNDNPSSTRIVKEAETFARTCLNYGRQSFLFHGLDPAFSVWPWLGGRRGVTVVCGPPKLNLTQQNLILQYLLLLRIEINNLLFSSSGGVVMKKDIKKSWCRHRPCKVRNIN